MSSISPSRMSLKLAEKKSGIENALVLLPALPPGKTIENTAAELLSKFRIGERRRGRGVLYLYSAKENGSMYITQCERWRASAGDGGKSREHPTRLFCWHVNGIKVNIKLLTNLSNSGLGTDL